ncbi:MAG: hypothetical protein WKG00_20320 [Polyangiaceae bacterium]
MAGSLAGACGPAFEKGPTGGTGATNGSGGAGGADAPCQPGTTAACYTGPADTQDVGLCKAGVKVCDADGVGYGACQGEVPPAEENCEQASDEDCDGSPNDGCPCEPGSEMECYSGPRGTAGVGSCVAGTQVCKNTGDEYGPCAGEVLPEAEDCSGTIDKDCSGFACAQPLWNKIAGDVSGQSGSAAGIDAAGNVYAMGSFAGTIDAGGGPLISAGQSDVFVVKYDAAGNHLWSKRFGNASNQVFGDMVVDANGNVAVAVMSFGAGGHSLVKLDGSGATIFSKPIGDAMDGAEAKVALDSSGSVAIATSFSGCFDSTCNIESAGKSDGYVARYSASGSLEWATAIGGAGDDYAGGVAFDASGNLIVVGSFEGTINLGNSAPTALTSHGSADMFVAKFDAAGAHAWSRNFGGAMADGIYSSGGSPVAVGATGNAIVVGSFLGTFSFEGQQMTPQGGVDILLFEITSGGVPSWAKPFGGSGYDGATGLALDADGDLVVSATSSGAIDFGGGVLPSAGGNDLVLAKLKADGSHVWSRRFGNAEAQYSGGVATGPSREIVVVAGSPGALDFGLGPLVSAGDSDALIAKFAP